MPTYQYLYGFTRAREWPPLVGVGGEGVTAVTRGGLSALTSRFEKSKVRPSRRHLLAHDRILRELLPSGILPVAFGTLASSRDSLEQLLDQNREDIEGNLDRLEGRVETAARARIQADNLFERFVAGSVKLRSARDRMVESGNADRDTMIAVGKLFSEVLGAERERVRSLFVAGVEGTAEDIRETPPKREAQIFDLAFLLPSDGVNAWESAVEAVASELDDDLVIDLAGPLPPYSFSTLALSPLEGRGGL